MTRQALRSPIAAILVLVGALSLAGTAQNVTLPLAKDSTRFAVIGDTGTGDKPQYDIGRRLEQYRQRVDFTFTIMVGDNIYGSEQAAGLSEEVRDPVQAAPRSRASRSTLRSATTTIPTSASTSRST